MPRPNTSLPGHLPPLHIYRHLLRECSYLPPAWRLTIISTIRDRFRQNRRNDKRQSKHRAQAYQVLNTLRSANDGYRPAMQNFMRMGFARTGIRRRSLMNKFVLRDGPSDSAALDALLDTSQKTKHKADDQHDKSSTAAATKNSKSAFHLNWDKSKLLKLLGSQQKQQKDTHLIWLHKEVRNTQENQYVPKATIWGKPPGDDLVATKRGHWWRRAAVKLMVPLNKAEWEVIGQLSTGAQETDRDFMVPERRKAAKPVLGQPPSNESGWDWEKYVDHSINFAERERSNTKVRRNGQKDTGPYQTRMAQTEITPRWYRRAYTRLWQITPTMEQDPRSLQHKISWGVGKTGLRSPHQSQLDIFEGVDEKGVKLPDSRSK